MKVNVCQNRSGCSDLWSSSGLGSTLLHGVEVEVLCHMSHALELLLARQPIVFVIATHVLPSFDLVVPEHLLVLFPFGLSIQFCFFIRGVERLVEVFGLHSLLVESLLILEWCGDYTLNQFGFHFSHVRFTVGNRVQELKVFVTG